MVEVVVMSVVTCSGSIAYKKQTDRQIQRQAGIEASEREGVYTHLL